MLSTRYLSGSRSLSLNGDFIAPSQNSFSSAINGNCRPDFAQYVNVSKDAVSANTVFNLIVLESESESLSLVTLSELCSRRIRLLSVYKSRLSPKVKLVLSFSMTDAILSFTTSPRSVRRRVWFCTDDECWLGIYAIIYINKDN